MSAPVRYVFFTVGPALEHHLQAWWAVATLRAHGAEDIGVVTDQPQRYADLGIRTWTVDADTIRAWRGPADYFWRVKIAAVRLAAADAPGPVCYLDTDVAAYAPLAGLAARLEAGACLMHVRERVLGRSPRSTHRRLFRAVRGTVCGGVAVTDDAELWNAGIIGLPAGSLPRIDRCLAACDDLYARSGGVWLCEQFAWVLALGQRHLEPAAPWLRHYWGNKPAWQRAIAERLAEALVAGGPQHLTTLVRTRPIDLPEQVRRRWWHRLAARIAV
jgi:hypothetical protein